MKYDDSEDQSLADFEVARLPIELQLSEGSAELFKEAANAIRQEHRHSTRWKRLTCCKVSLIADRERGTVCVLHLDGPVEFDWTWEGALAFRPQILDDSATASRFSYEQAAFEPELQWKGEVLEVDERHGCLFLCLDNPEQIPTVGPFLVRPFEFLSVLDSIYNDESQAEFRNLLPARLAATTGKEHPEVSSAKRVGLPHLRNWWRFAWSILWGPPGTGKTWTTGRQVAAALADPSERILVVSTTNRATDAVAMAIGQAARDGRVTELNEGQLVRIGKGAALRSFEAAGLQVMLQGTESEVLQEIDELGKQLRQTSSRDERALTRQRLGQLRSRISDESQRNFLDADVRVVIATAFKATSYLDNPLIKQGLAEQSAPFTTIFIDEAGLMSRVAVAALSLLASRRVVLVGDSKQLSPISRLSRILPIRQQRWLASSGLAHLTEIEHTPPAVTILTEQRRMHPDVCRLVSHYQYSGQLRTAPETMSRPSSLSPWIADYSRTIWYVLDDEGTDLWSVRAQRGPAGSSWVRAITPAILQKLFQDSGIRQTRGLFISPFAAQAQAVASLFSQWELPNWEASTVHSQQGSEADIVIFDTVNAGSYTWPFDEWKRLVNVALSRAREAVVVLSSRDEMDEPYLKPLLRGLTASRLVETPAGLRWEAVERRKPKANATTARDAREQYQVMQPAASMGAQMRQRQQMKSVLSHQQQRLAGTELDGKPRLVRGVAGSGKSYVLCHWLARTVMRMQPSPETRVWAVYANRSLHKLLQESVELAWLELWKDSLFEVPEFPWGTVELLHVRDVLSGILPSANLSMGDFEFDYDRAAEEFLNRYDAAGILPSCAAMFIDEAQDMGPSTLKLLLAMVEQSDAADPSSRAAHLFYDNMQNIYSTKTPTWSEFGLNMRGRSVIMRESFRSTRPIIELAMNVLSRLDKSAEREDWQELITMGLLRQSQRRGTPWLDVRFNQVQGPWPILRTFEKPQDEMDTLAQHLIYLIQKEDVSPKDICILYNGKNIAQQLAVSLTPQLAAIGVELSLQTNRAFERRENTLIMTTAHSFKGYESEVVFIPGVDRFVAPDGQILANNLYVAMTRARSLLAVYGLRRGPASSRQLMQQLIECFECLQSPSEEPPLS